MSAFIYTIGMVLLLVGCGGDGIGAAPVANIGEIDTPTIPRPTKPSTEGESKENKALEEAVAKLTENANATNMRIADLESQVVAAKTLLAQEQESGALLKSAMASLRDELAQAKKDLTGTNDEITTTRKDVTAVNLKLGALEPEVSVLRTDLGIAKSENQAMKGDLASAHVDLKKIARDLAKADLELAAAKAEITTARSQNTALTRDLGHTKDSLAAANKELDLVRNDLVTARGETAVVGDDLKILQLEMNSVKLELGLAQQGLLAIAPLEAEILEVRAELDLAQQRLLEFKPLPSDLAMAKDEIASLKTSYAKIAQAQADLWLQAETAKSELVEANQQLAVYDELLEKIEDLSAEIAVNEDSPGKGSVQPESEVEADSEQADFTSSEIDFERVAHHGKRHTSYWRHSSSIDQKIVRSGADSSGAQIVYIESASNPNRGLILKSTSNTRVSIVEIYQLAIADQQLSALATERIESVDVRVVPDEALSQAAKKYLQLRSEPSKDLVVIPTPRKDLVHLTRPDEGTSKAMVIHSSPSGIANTEKDFEYLMHRAPLNIGFSRNTSTFDGKTIRSGVTASGEQIVYIELGTSPNRGLILTSMKCGQLASPEIFQIAIANLNVESLQTVEIQGFSVYGVPDQAISNAAREYLQLRHGVARPLEGIPKQVVPLEEGVDSVLSGSLSYSTSSIPEVSSRDTDETTDAETENFVIVSSAQGDEDANDY